MNKKLYVSNLPFAMDDEGFKEAFAGVGSVVSAKVIMDRRSGRSKGFGFIEMSTDAEAKEAMNKLNGANIHGRTITIAEAKEEQRDFSQQRDFGGGGGGGYRPRYEGNREGGHGGGGGGYRNNNGPRRDNDGGYRNNGGYDRHN